MSDVQWRDSQVRDVVRAVRGRLRTAWDYMTVDTRRAYLHMGALSLIRIQDRESVSIASMDELVRLVEEYSEIDVD